MLDISLLVARLFQWRSCGPMPLRLWITPNDYARLGGAFGADGRHARTCAGVPVSIDTMHGGPGSRVVFVDGSSVSLEIVCGAGCG